VRRKVKARGTEEQQRRRSKGDLTQRALRKRAEFAEKSGPPRFLRQGKQSAAQQNARRRRYLFARIVQGKEKPRYRVAERSKSKLRTVPE